MLKYGVNLWEEWIKKNLWLWLDIFIFKFYMLKILLFKNNCISLAEFETEANFIVFGYATVSFASCYYFFHEFAIAIDIDNSCPILDPDGKNFDFDSFFKIIFFADLKMLEFKDCCFSSFHADD